MKLWIYGILLVLFAAAALWLLLSGKDKSRKIWGWVCAAAAVAAAVLLILSLTGGKPDAPAAPTEPSQSSTTEAATEAPTEAPTQPEQTEASLTPEEQERQLVLERAESTCQYALELMEGTMRPEESHKRLPYEPSPKGLARLDEKDAAYYWELQEKVKNLEDFTYMAADLDEDGMDRILNAFAALGEDHPIYGAFVTIYTLDEGPKTVGLQSRYFLQSDPELDADKEALRQELETFNQVCQIVVDHIPQDASTYDQYRFLATYLTLNTYYDMNNNFAEISTPYGAILPGRAICKGYSEALVHLCKKADLFCRRVDGAADGEGHSWNLIALEDGTYHVDITWSDNGQNLPTDPDWFRYFCVTQDRIQEDHVIEDGTVATGQRNLELSEG